MLPDAVVVCSSTVVVAAASVVVSAASVVVFADSVGVSASVVVSAGERWYFNFKIANDDYFIVIYLNH